MRLDNKVIIASGLNDHISWFLWINIKTPISGVYSNLRVENNSYKCRTNQQRLLWWIKSKISNTINPPSEFLPSDPNP